MQMENRLAGAAAVVDDRTIAGEQTELCGQLRGEQLQLAEERLVAGLGVVQRREMFSRTNENVRGCLRIDVFKGEHVVIFIDELRGNLLRADFAEQAVRIHLLRS